MKSFCRLLAIAAFLPLLGFAAGAGSADGTISQARKYLGKDRDLDAVRTLHYRGCIEVASGAQKESGSFEMLLQNPYRNRTVQVLGDRRTIVGLDDMSGWVRVESVAKPELSRTEILDLPQLRNLRAQTFENLAFYRGAEKEGVKIEPRGEGTVAGRRANSVAFVHPHGIVYVRSFDVATGQLLDTEVPGGAHMREEGELTVAGIRFPKRIVSTTKSPDGAEVVVTIVFDDIKVNEAFAPDTFVVPLLGER
jgi:hypothetical protein